MGLFFVHFSVAGSYWYTIPMGFQRGARPAKTYNLPAAATPDISSAGSGKGASFTHLVWAQAAGAHNSKASMTGTNRPLSQRHESDIYLFSPRIAQAKAAKTFGNWSMGTNLRAQLDAGRILSGFPTWLHQITLRAN